MMIYPPFNRQNMESYLMKLEPSYQLAFGAVCCERLIPNYQAFMFDSHSGNYESLRKSLDSIWEYLGNNHISTQEVENFLSLCQLAAPDSEVSQSKYVTAAQDACFAICCLFDFIKDNSNSERIAQVAEYATDSIDLYIQVIEALDPNHPNLDDKILRHPLMQRELHNQMKDLDLIKNSQTLDGAFLGVLKRLSDGKGNFI